jgi:hypothetical protein
VSFPLLAWCQLYRWNLYDTAEISNRLY